MKLTFLLSNNFLWKSKKMEAITLFRLSEHCKWACEPSALTFHISTVCGGAATSDGCTPHCPVLPDLSFSVTPAGSQQIQLRHYFI